jgi:hypothetical protein
MPAISGAGPRALSMYRIERHAAHFSSVLVRNEYCKMPVLEFGPLIRESACNRFGHVHRRNIIWQYGTAFVVHRFGID